MRQLTREFLKERKRDVEEDPSIMESDSLTLSTIWYRLRPKFIDAGIKFSKTTRRTVQIDYVREICEDELGVKRADLGIHAAVRAQLYYRGETFDISLDNKDDLADKGTDILIIEKEGIAEVFAPFAAKMGIAILNVRGFFTENAEDYSQLVREKLEGKNVATFHDFDAAGVVIGKKARGIVNLGVDPELVSELGLQMEDVEEAYDGDNGGHWKWLKANYPGYGHLAYLKDNRIEIDSLNAVVKAKRLWEAVLSRLKKAFPKRDYNRALVIGTYESPVWYDHFTNAAEKLFRLKAEVYNDEIEERYSNYKGIIKDVEKEELKIRMGQMKEIEEDDIVSALEPRVRAVADWLEEQLNNAQE